MDRLVNMTDEQWERKMFWWSIRTCLMAILFGLMLGCIFIELVILVKIIMDTIR